MKRIFLTLLAAVGLLVLGRGEARAQFPVVPVPAPGLVVPAPVVPPYVYQYATKQTPFGIGSYYRAQTYPDVFGNSYYQYRYQYARPYAVGPRHSVYFDPAQNTYVYVPNFGW
jgi:hypothetical protein